MNVYDFDKTIYKSDSSIDFYLFCLFRHPSIIKYLPFQLNALTMFLTGKITKTKMKEVFYRYFEGIDDIDNEVNLFWENNFDKINKWYIDVKKDDDVIISASPHFFLKPVCGRLGVSNLIASNVDKKSGKYIGKNCWGEEKLKRFKERFNNIRPENFYSDSYCDEPMAKISKNAYIVRGSKIKPW